MEIRIKRAYSPPSNEDGKRILIDRLWPRGLTKEKLKIDLWLKDIAPSSGLRTWFGHDSSKWPEFKNKYLVELEQNSEAVKTLEQEIKAGTVTLIYGAKDEEHNDAVVLKQFLEQKLC